MNANLPAPHEWEVTPLPAGDFRIVWSQAARERYFAMMDEQIIAAFFGRKPRTWAELTADRLRHAAQVLTP